MYKYQYRAFDKYKKNVIAIAIFIDNEDNYIPDNFYSSLYGTKIHYKYNIYKVLAQKEEELKNNDNPFALVVLSSLYYLKAKKNQKKRLNYKLKLIELLAEKNYTGEEIEELFDFIDLLINFKDYKFDYKFYEELDKMPKVQEKKEIGGFKKVLIKKDRIEVARNLKNLGVDIDKILQATGLSKKELDEL